ncbi:MAG TPA: hypothetical protein VM492_03080, partial [Sumerlaeia bacterium]|nr:hypothetical protein [Sumerlaeia bacterium]
MRTDPLASPVVPGARDWIVAPATGMGPCAIAIVRLDGPGCWQAASKVWAPSPATGDAPDDANVRDAQPASVQRPPSTVGRARPSSAAASQESDGQPREAAPPPPRRLTRGLMRDASGAPVDEAFAAWFP